MMEWRVGELHAAGCRLCGLVSGKAGLIRVADAAERVTREEAMAGDGEERYERKRVGGDTCAGEGQMRQRKDEERERNMI